MAGELPVIIAGGGIGGLAAALALARHEFPLVVLERASEFGEIGAGIQMAPNAFHCFDALLGGNVEGGIESAFTLMLLAVALVGGLLLASTVLPEARGPRREYLSEDWLGRQPMR